MLPRPSRALYFFYDFVVILYIPRDRLVFGRVQCIPLVNSTSFLLLPNFAHNMDGLLLLVLEQDSNELALFRWLPKADILIRSCYLRDILHRRFRARSTAMVASRLEIASLSAGSLLEVRNLMNFSFDVHTC